MGTPAVAGYKSTEEVCALELLHKILKTLELFVGWVFSPQWLPPKDFEFYRWLFTPGYGYGVVLVLFAVLEMVIPRDRRRLNRATWLSGTYLLFAGKTGIYALVIVPLFRQGWLYLNLPSLHLDRKLPFPVYSVVSVLVVTFLAYWAHRWMHEVPALWHIHKIHHAVVNVNWSSVYQRHFLETLLHEPLFVLAALALGTELVAPFGIVLRFIDVLGHSNIDFDFGRLNYFLSTPQVHKIHHSAQPEHFNTNYGNTFMVWDHLFGTFCNDRENPRTGVDEAIPMGFLKQQIMPVVWIGQDAWAWAMWRRIGGAGGNRTPE